MIRPFSIFYVGEWKAGGVPLDDADTMSLVIHDQRTEAYALDDPSGDHNEFIEWVAVMWESETDPRQPEETAQDYLERIDVTVR